MNPVAFALSIITTATPLIYQAENALETGAQKLARVEQEVKNLLNSPNCPINWPWWIPQAIRDFLVNLLCQAAFNLSPLNKANKQPDVLVEKAAIGWPGVGATQVPGSGKWATPTGDPIP